MEGGHSVFDETLLDKMSEECGVFGVYHHTETPQLIYYGLQALQHRGQESAGIVSSNHEFFTYHHGMGLVTEVFHQQEINRLNGMMGIGHVRYSTTGESKLQNAQPLVFKYRNGEIAIATNGNLTNAMQIRNQLERQGSIFQTTSDTEVIAHLIAKSMYDDIEQAVKEALSVIKGAYALLIMTNDKLIAALDSNGLRPLSLGKLEHSYLLSSETCAFDTVGATTIRDIEPGEMLVFDKDGIRSEHFTVQTRRAICSFEYIYFARPDSDIGGINVHLARKRLGKKLAEEHPVEADVVTGVPDSSISAAIGYAEASGIPYELGLIKNRYIARTFIQPSQELREKGVKMKLSAVRKVVDGKRVVMIDDSIVRGTTSKRIVQLLKEAGAKEVHVRISSPPVKNPCYYGIDTSSREELIAAAKTIEEMKDFIGADSLAFLSMSGMLEAIGRQGDDVNHGYCVACFNAEYPTEVYQSQQSKTDKVRWGIEDEPIL